MNRHTPPTDDDADAFDRAMADVTPLPPDRRGRVRPAPRLQPQPTAPAPASTSSRTPNHDAADAAENDEESYAADGVDRRELRKLKRGAHDAGSRLDIHGQTAAQALASVARFIDAASHRHRVVCIVHGKGLHSGGQTGVLKVRVRAFLRQQRAVLAYTDAPRTDGGSGAVYVLLRK